jgi:hypothetical protein
MTNKEDLAREIYGILIKNQKDEALERLVKSKSERRGLARLAHGLAEAFIAEYEKRNPNKIPWEN